MIALTDRRNYQDYNYKLAKKVSRLQLKILININIRELIINYKYNTHNYYLVQMISMIMIQFVSDE